MNKSMSYRLINARYAVAVLICLISFSTCFTSYANEKIDPIASIMARNPETTTQVAGIERCAGLYLFLSIKTDSSGFKEQAEGMEESALLFALYAASLENSVNRERGLAERDLTRRKEILYANTIVQMALMYGEESKKNYTRTGQHIVGLVADDVETCKILREVIVKNMK